MGSKKAIKESSMKKLKNPPKPEIEKNKGGRPRVYDPVIIGQEMLEWVKDIDSINIAQFCADRGYLPPLIWRLEKECEEFADAYGIVKLKLAARREVMLNEGLLNYGTWQRYQRGYDAFLAKDEDEKDDKDAARRKGVADSSQMNLFLLAQMVADGKITQKD